MEGLKQPENLYVPLNEYKINEQQLEQEMYNMQVLTENLKFDCIVG